MIQDLFGLAYVSRSVFADRPDQLRLVVQDILAAAMRNNPQYQVTGVLLVGETHFAQMLEGPQWAVETVMEVVRRDPRHCEVEVLFIEPLTHRRFGKWAMAYASPPEGATPGRVIGIVDSPDQIGFAARGHDLVQDLRELLASTEAEAGPPG